MELKPAFVRGGEAPPTIAAVGLGSSSICTAMPRMRFILFNCQNLSVC